MSDTRRTSSIRSIAYSLPTGVLSEAELVERFGEAPIRAITKMSGVRSRRVVVPGQTASDLAYDAALRVLAHADVDPASIDLLTFASQTPDYRIPATSAVLHGRLGLSQACCTFDIGQACSSYVQSLQVAHSMIVAGTAHRALVLNADALTTLISPGDRSLVPLHGDAGTATLLEPSTMSEGGIEFIESGTDGSLYDRLMVPAGGARMPCTPDTAVATTYEDGCIRSLDHLMMDGPAVFHFAVYKVPEVIGAAMARAGLTVDDVDLVLLHQANKMMVDLIYRSLKIPKEKRFMFLEDVGNSSGASLPTLLGEAWRAGMIRPGSRTILCAFGGGLSWGVASIKWPDDAAAAAPGSVDVAFDPSAFPAARTPAGA